MALALSALIAAPAHAVCFARDTSKPGGWDLDKSGPARTFSIEDEFARAFTVVTARVTAARSVTGKDGGLKANKYRVQPVETLKGPQLAEFTVYNANNSGRFDMDAGKTYLLFVSAQEGRSVIDACGWSDALALAGDTLSKASSLSETNRPPPHF